MLITTKTVLDELQKSVPNFQIDSEWLSDGLTYPAFGDFARFICSEAEVLQHVHSEAEASELSQVRISMALLERALQEGDSDVRDLVFDCVETIASCDRINQIKKYFGPELNALWSRHFSNPQKNPS
jgi:hypothetical protein